MEHYKLIQRIIENIYDVKRIQIKLFMEYIVGSGENTKNISKSAILTLTNTMYLVHNENDNWAYEIYKDIKKIEGINLKYKLEEYNELARVILDMLGISNKTWSSRCYLEKDENGNFINYILFSVKDFNKIEEIIKEYVYNNVDVRGYFTYNNVKEYIKKEDIDFSYIDGVFIKDLKNNKVIYTKNNNNKIYKMSVLNKKTREIDELIKEDMDHMIMTLKV